MGAQDWAVHVSVSDDHEATGHRIWTCDMSKLTPEGDLYAEVPISIHDDHIVKLACRFAFLGEAATHEHEWARSASALNVPTRGKTRSRMTLHREEDFDLD